MIDDKTFHSRVDSIWPKVIEAKPSAEENTFYRDKIKRLLKEQDACLVAHYYVDSEIQKLAEETGGMLGDSFAMAKFGKSHKASTILVAGVRFMAESAKILSPEKRVLVPTLEADCSLDVSCQVGEFQNFIAEHPDREVVVYINTSAAVKACADWVVTSSIALDVVRALDEQGKKILWAPDKYLGRYIEKQTGADMVHWNGACIVHEEFKTKALIQLKTLYPDAAVLVHPEAPPGVVDLADVAGSTSQLLEASKKLSNSQFIVATEAGILYKMRQANPHKLFLEAPTAGQGATCKSCAHCPWMGMNHLKNLSDALEFGRPEVFVAEEVRLKALKGLDRMVNFKK